MVTKTSVSEQDGKKLVTVRLMITGRSMWLNINGLKTAKLNSKETELEVDDDEFNSSNYEVLKCSNENGAYLKLVPKCEFKEAAF